MTRSELSHMAGAVDDSTINIVVVIINVKKLQFIHMLKATDLHTSKTAKIKKLYYYITAHRRTSIAAV